jgi:hypothetical protein
VSDISVARLPVRLAALVFVAMVCGILTSHTLETVVGPTAGLTVTSTATLTLSPAATHRPTSSPSPSPTQSPVKSTPRAQRLGKTATPTHIPTSTNTPAYTPSPRSTASPLPPTPDAPSPTRTATLVPSPALPTDTPSVASEDDAPRPVYGYLPVGTAQPELSQPCPGCPRAPGYIVGRVVDADGVPLAGVRLVCYNDWHRYPVVGSKGGGEYDFPILQAEATWYVVILDEADNPMSPEAPVFFNPLEACWYRLDWQRLD